LRDIGGVTNQRQLQADRIDTESEPCREGKKKEYFRLGKRANSENSLPKIWPRVGSARIATVTAAEDGASSSSQKLT
jgi:hypothetical protein